MNRNKNPLHGLVFTHKCRNANWFMKDTHLGDAMSQFTEKGIQGIQQHVPHPDLPQQAKNPGYVFKGYIHGLTNYPHQNYPNQK